MFFVYFAPLLSLVCFPLGFMRSQLIISWSVYPVFPSCLLIMFQSLMMSFYCLFFSCPGFLVLYLPCFAINYITSYLVCVPVLWSLAWWLLVCNKKNKQTSKQKKKNSMSCVPHPKPKITFPMILLSATAWPPHSCAWYLQTFDWTQTLPSFLLLWLLLWFWFCLCLCLLIPVSAYPVLHSDPDYWIWGDVETVTKQQTSTVQHQRSKPNSYPFFKNANKNTSQSEMASSVWRLYSS